MVRCSRVEGRGRESGGAEKKVGQRGMEAGGTERDRDCQRVR